MLIRRTMLVGLVLMSSLAASAQVSPQARSGSSTLSAGAEFSIFQIDAATHPVEFGIGAFVDFDPFRSLGLEVEGRTIQFHERQDLRRDSISGGFRYKYHYRQFVPYAKVLAGIGSGDFPRGTYCCGLNDLRQHDTFTTITLGGGVDYKLTHRISLRGEYEYQYWLDYGGGQFKPLGISNPNGYSIGASYRIF